MNKSVFIKLRLENNQPSNIEVIRKNKPQIILTTEPDIV